MNTDLLRTFLEVAKTRHFGHAAENLFLTQSAISSRIKQLESTLGVPLFTRQRNNILLTPAGERLLPHAENLLTAWQIAVQEVGIPTRQSMQLTLGGTTNLWDSFLQSVLPKLAARFPELYLRTEIESAQELTRALLGGRVDIIIVLNSPRNIDIESRRIGGLELVMVASKKNSSITDIPKIGHIFVDWGTAFNLQQARLFEEPVAPILHTGQAHIALEFLLSHGGAAFLPKTLVEPYLEQGNLFLVESIESARQDVHLAFTRDSEKLVELSPIIAALEETEIRPETVVVEI
ncbi:LysR family transcriptional regulator [bacterium]|nr:LysR family transcriptional regulator [bacterium]